MGSATSKVRDVFLELHEPKKRLEGPNTPRNHRALTIAHLVTKQKTPKKQEAIGVLPYTRENEHVKGMYPAPHIHEHFTIHKWLRQTAYILTHNVNKLEHIANNCMNTTMHTDANIAQF